MLDHDFEKLLKDIRTNVFNKDFLDLRGQELIDEKIIQLAETLANNHYIKKIDLSYNNIGDDGIIALSKINTISELDVHNGLDGYDEYYNHITSKGALALARSNLKKLNISGNVIGDEGVKSLSTNNNIVELDVEDCGINAEGAAEFFKTNDMVVKLNLQGNNIGDHGLSTLKYNNKLKELNLSSCQITHVGLKFIAENSSLTSLQLNNNKVSNGVFYLAKHNSLKILNLSECEINDSDLELFAKNNVLTELYLQYNNITAEGVKKIAESSTISILHLEHNNIYFDKALIQLLLSMKSLTVLNGEDNQVAREVQKILEEECKKTQVQQINLTIHQNIDNTICLQYTAKTQNKRTAKRKAEELILSQDIKEFIFCADQEQISDFIKEITDTIKQQWEQTHKKAAYTESNFTVLRQTK